MLGDRRPELAGSCVVPIMEGSRTLLVEVQALVNPTAAPMPRRSAQGLDNSRLAILAAVVERRLNFKLSEREVFASALGGVRVAEPAGDLGITMALASAYANRPVTPNVVACGEVGLGGEVRRVAQMERRLGEAARLGFTEAIVPQATPDVAGITLHRINDLQDIRRFLIDPPTKKNADAF